MHFAKTTVVIMDVTILLTKTTASQNEVALRYYTVRGLYFLAAVFVTNIILSYMISLITN